MTTDLSDKQALAAFDDVLAMTDWTADAPTVVKKRRLYFTMVCHPLGAKRVGNAYATKQDARDAVSFVRGAWRGLRVVIS